MADLTTTDDLTDILKIQLSSLSTLITESGYELICDQVSRELGWSYPVTNPTQVLWMVKRGTRHALNILMIAAAYKFKYKTVSLNQRFEHFRDLIADMDKEFETAMTADIALFAGLDSYKMFGTKIDAGFSYDPVGAETTYNLDQYVMFSPAEE